MQRSGLSILVLALGKKKSFPSRHLWSIISRLQLRFKDIPFLTFGSLSNVLERVTTSFWLHRLLSSVYWPFSNCPFKSFVGWITLHFWKCFHTCYNLSSTCNTIYHPFLFLHLKEDTGIKQIPKMVYLSFLR